MRAHRDAKAMRKFVTVLAAFAAFVSAEDFEEYVPSIRGMQSLSMMLDNDTKLALVRSFENHPDFDLVRIPRAPDESTDALVAARSVDEFKNLLRDNGVEFKVVADDISKLITPKETRARSRRVPGNIIDFRTFPRYDEIVAYIEHLSKTHSDVAEAISIGKSYEGRDIVGIKISRGSEEKPTILIDAGIHAREWISVTTALYAIEQLVQNASNYHILRNVHFYIIPVLNPDGYEYTHLDEDTRLWRKTRSRQSLFCKGVDANRNFSYKWMTVGASSSPCSGTYAGSKPFSEPETQALRDFILAHRDLIRVYVTLHSYGNYFLYPWGFTRQLPENVHVLRCVAVKAEAELSKVRGTRYTIGSSTNALYPAAGGSDDWAMAVAGVELSYTVELPGGRYGFVPPPQEIIPVGHETFKAIKVLAQYVNGEICQESSISYS